MPNFLVTHFNIIHSYCCYHYTSIAIPLGIIVVRGDCDLETCRIYVDRLEEVSRLKKGHGFHLEYTLDLYKDIHEFHLDQNVPKDRSKAKKVHQTNIYEVKQLKRVPIRITCL